MNERFYNLCFSVLRPFYGLFLPAKVDGLENVPATGGFILCANHLSNRDPFYLSICVKPRNRHPRFMAKSELFRFRVVAAFLRALGAFPVDRGHSDMASVRTALKLLAEGRCLGIFPQGTRSKDNTPTPMFSGTSLFALRTGLPVIPAYIGGPYRLFRRTPVRFGAPVDLSAFGRKMDGETLKEATACIERAIWALKDDAPDGR